MELIIVGLLASCAISLVWINLAVHRIAASQARVEALYYAQQAYSNAYAQRQL